MPDTGRKWTREMVLALPDDGNRYELFDGELLVTPAPSGLHQLAHSLLWTAVGTFVNAHGLGWMMSSPPTFNWAENTSRSRISLW